MKQANTVEQLINRLNKTIKKSEEAHLKLKYYVKDALDNIKHKPNILRLDLWFRYVLDIYFLRQAMPIVKQQKMIRRMHKFNLEYLERMKEEARNPWV